MKAIVTYIGGFNIPKELPHAGPEEGVDTENCDWRIFSDSVSEFENPETGAISLRITSNCGVTDIWEWLDYGDHYCIPAKSQAHFNGARNALNSIWGIKFPEYDVIGIESTIGRFQTLADYDYACGIILPLMKHVERFLEVPHDNVVRKPAKVAQASTWLANLENALRPVIDMDDPCRNPIHPDGSRGYLA